MDSETTCRSPNLLPLTRQATRELLEYLMTRGVAADLDAADPAWFKNPPADDGALEWYNQFGDGSKVMWGRAELLRMVVELRRTSRAPAALALNATAWFEEWVELPHPCLGLQAPAEVLCTPVRKSCSDRCRVQRATVPPSSANLTQNFRRSAS